MPRGKHSNHRRGPSHPRWNDGQIVSSHGYVRVRVGREHQHADPNGYAYEHLLVWLAAGHSAPWPMDVLHHANGDKLDNRIENLTLVTRQEHAQEHHRMVSDTLVRIIRERYASGEDGTAIAADVGLPASRVYRFIKGETRVCAGGPIVTGSLRGKRAAGRLLDGRTWDEVPR